jgi:hypothetical protein
MIMGHIRRLLFLLSMVVVVGILGLLGSTLVGTSGGAAAISHATSAQYGVNVYVTDTCASSPTWQATANNESSGIKSLGANTIAIAFPFYTASLNSNSVFAANQCPGSSDPDPAVSPQSPTAARVAVLVKSAQAHGLHVLLRPELNEVDLRPKWRGVIAPTNTTAWFASYQSMMKPYLQMAQTDKVTRFDISVELSSMAGAKQWASAITADRKLYTGQLVFDGDWVGPGSGSVGLAPHANTAWAVDTYPKVTKSTPSSSVSQLLGQWNSLLAAQKFPVSGASATIDEVGIIAQDGAYANPSTFTGGTFDPKIQANWFSASCQFMKAHKFAGVYFWGPEFSYNSGKLPTTSDSTHPTELQPQAQSAIKACFE